MSSLILNLACGYKTSDKCVNIDRSIYLRVKRLPLNRLFAPLIFNGARLEQYRRIAKSQILVHDLRKGIPYPDNSVDAVYHSHFLEHLERNSAKEFLREVLRVLKPGGIQRIVVPDLQHMCRTYLDDLDECIRTGTVRGEHEHHIEYLIDQMVRSEADGTSKQHGMRKAMENLVLGDSRARGENHLWMYDQISLSVILAKAGFREVDRCDYLSSSISGWNDTALDRDDRGGEYKPGSLYMEAWK